MVRSRWQSHPDLQPRPDSRHARSERFTEQDQGFLADDGIDFDLRRHRLGDQPMNIFQPLGAKGFEFKHGGPGADFLHRRSGEIIFQLRMSGEDGVRVAIEQIWESSDIRYSGPSLKKMGRETSARQTQARALGWQEIKEFIGSAGQGFRADRERALLCVAYETLARRGELVALEVRDIEFWPNGTGQALIRRGKTDAEGQGRVAYLSRETVKWLKIWLEHAKIAEGPIFRRLIGRDQIGEALHRAVSPRSSNAWRVGAAQDLAELDIDLAAITQAGGWKSTRMPLQYAEKINVARSGMARATAATGRDESVSK